MASQNPHPPYTGGCYCGANRYTLKERPESISFCHCTTCRHVTGASFLPFIGMKLENFQWTTDSPTRKTVSLSDIASRTFCTECGTQLTMYYGKNYPDRIGVTVGSVDDEFSVVLAGVLKNRDYRTAEQIFVTQIPPWAELRVLEDHVQKYDRFAPYDASLQESMDA